jgi:predicted amidohydrolase
VALFLVVSALACDRVEPVADRDWAGVSTRYGRLSDVGVDEQFDRAVSAGQAAVRTGAKVVLFPEGVAGRWTRSTAALWTGEAAESDQVLLVGAIEERGGERRNGLAIAGEGEARFWPQRLPAPIGMWAPWRSAHVQSDLLRSSVTEILGRRVALLVCFEQFVSWPLLQSALEGADVVLTPANLWFANGTNLNAVREVTLRSWASLMGWSVVEAINE